MAANTHVYAKTLLPNHAIAKVKSLALVGSRPAAGGDISKIYHWRFYARLDNDESSAVFDMTPAAFPAGVLVVNYKSALTSTAPSHIDKAVPFLVSKTPTELLQFMTDRHFERYEFTDDGSGCRFWCLTVIQALEDNHWIAAGATKWFEGWIEQQSEELGVKCIPQPPPQGRFYW